MRASRAFLRFGAWFALWLLIPYLVFVGGGWAGLYATELRAFSVIVIALGLAAWGLAMARNPAWLPRSELWPAFGASLAVFLVGVLFSRMPRLGWEYLAYSVLLAALYLLFCRILAEGGLRSRTMTIVVVVALLNGVAYLVEVGSAWLAWWDLVGRVTTPPLRPAFAGLLLGNPSAVMTVQVLLSTASVACLGWHSRARRALSAVLVFLAVAATVLSGSRSGWLALAVALALVALAWLSSGVRRRQIGTVFRSRRVRVAAAVGTAAAIGVGVVLAPGVLFRAVSGGESYRLANFAEAWRMFVDAPLVGTGPGTWVAQRIAYTAPDEPDYYIPYAHNLPLQTLAEFGVLGAAAGVVVTVALVRLILRGVRDTDPVRSRMGWAGALGTAYFVAHQLFDFYGSSPAALFTFVIPIAYLDGTAPTGSRPSTRARPTDVAAVAGFAACAAAVVGLLLSERTAATMARAVELANQGRWTDALPIARDGAARDLDIPAYRFTLATIADHAGEDATSAYEASAAADSFPASWLGVAAGHAQAGRADAARAALDKALRLGRQQIAIVVGAADVYLVLGDTDRAIELLGDAVIAAPSLAGDPRWASDPRLAAVRDPVIERARSRITGEAAVELALVTQRPDEAARIAATLSEPAKGLMQLVVRAWEGDGDAMRALVARAEAQPLDLVNLRWGARVAARNGDMQTAERLRSWSEAVNGGSSLASLETRFADPDAAPGVVAGLAGQFYGHYTYRRPTPLDQVAAGLLQLELE